MSYTYLFIRTDLSVPQQIIQTAHAMEKVASGTRDSSAVLFSVKDEAEL